MILVRFWPKEQTQEILLVFFFKGVLICDAMPFTSINLP